jgi:hypothetical protein
MAQAHVPVDLAGIPFRIRLGREAGVRQIGGFQRGELDGPDSENHSLARE